MGAHHREGLVDRPGPEVEEAAEELEGPEAVLLGEEDLQHHGELLGGLTVL